jgi:hypothetical protein
MPMPVKTRSSHQPVLSISWSRRTFTAKVGKNVTSSKMPLSGDPVGPLEGNIAPSRIPVASPPITVNRTQSQYSDRIARPEKVTYFEKPDAIA